jgi:glycosyltransferase involved in cell wall biosynthesis
VKQEYAAFLGRVSPEKGVDKAIRIAGKAGLKLKIAAKVANAEPLCSRRSQHDSHKAPTIAI